jgi:4-alpha-glucanotransferase
MAFALPQYVHLGREISGVLNIAEQREWWLSNGKGGYAGGTIAGTLTRRYHGLLIAPCLHTMQRHLLFTKADAELLDNGRTTPLHTNRWGSGAIEPRGHLAIESFHLDGRMPVWRYRLDGMLIEARIWMEHGMHSTCLAWRLLENHEDRQVYLRVRLLTNVRDHHGTTGFAEELPEVTVNDHEMDVTHSDCCSTLRFRSRCGVVEHSAFWAEDFDLPVERERGLPDRDRHYCVGYMTFPIHEGHWVGLTASIENDIPPYYMEDAMQRFQKRDLSMLTQTKVSSTALSDVPAWIDQLILAADSFIIKNEQTGTERSAIVAGYPWFGEWGRDTMIALPGLLLATGRYGTARSLLLEYLPFVNCGMLPNYFPNDGETPEYNTVDAALWYIEAWRAYIENSHDHASLDSAWHVLQKIVTHYRNGTRHGIIMDATDGLLHAGEAGLQLTWMDAKVGDMVITPRIGKPVEVNALWYNALQTMAQFALTLNDDALFQAYSVMAEHTRTGFQRFLRPDQEGLYDVLDVPEGRHDDRIRPNQILAVSLTYSALEPDAQSNIVKTCKHHLLTPYGLRTLASHHAEYRGQSRGGVWERDSAYHQGTVWNWLLGHYALAEYRVTGNAEQAMLKLEPVQRHLNEAGLGTISEIFDGDPPHTPRGCPAQAWSVACTLEAWWKLQQAIIAHQKEKRDAIKTET